MTYSRAASARWRRCLDGVLVLTPSVERPVLLDPPGDVIWELLATPRTEDELVAELLVRYCGDVATITGDVQAFLRDLCRCDAVVGR